jgi:hypothetical protein
MPSAGLALKEILCTRNLICVEGGISETPE